MKLSKFVFMLMLLAGLSACGENAQEIQQNLEIQALNQAVQNAAANSSNVTELVSQLPGECAGVEVENSNQFTIIKCLIENIQTTYLVDRSEPDIAFPLSIEPSCNLVEEAPIPQNNAADVDIYFFINGVHIADLSSGLQPRFALIQEPEDIEEFGIPCNFIDPIFEL